MPTTPREGELHDQPRSTEERFAELAALRESGEIAEEDYNTNLLLWFIELDAPLTAADLQNCALVMTRAEFKTIGSFDIVLPNGERTTLDSENFSDEILIIYPKDLGNDGSVK